MEIVLNPSTYVTDFIYFGFLGGPQAAFCQKPFSASFVISK